MLTPQQQRFVEKLATDSPSDTPVPTPAVKPLGVLPSLAILAGTTGVGALLGRAGHGLYELINPNPDEDQEKWLRRHSWLSGAGVGLGTGLSQLVRAARRRAMLSSAAQPVDANRLLSRQGDAV